MLWEKRKKSFPKEREYLQKRKKQRHHVRIFLQGSGAGENLKGQKRLKIFNSGKSKHIRKPSLTEANVLLFLKMRGRNLTINLLVRHLKVANRKLKI
jgi:hypothetical protein